MVKDFKLRRCISRFRLTSHHLAIETGRHTKPKTPEDERLCTYCNKNKIENELHMFIECDFYTDERITLLVNIINCELDFFGEVDIYSPLDTMIHIMSSKNDMILFYVGKFIDKCLTKRTMHDL